MLRILHYMFYAADISRRLAVETQDPFISHAPCFSPPIHPEVRALLTCFGLTAGRSPTMLATLS